MKPHFPFAAAEGQGLVEYALILVLVAIVVIVILATMGPAISGVYCDIVVELGSPCAGGGSHYYDTAAELSADCVADGGSVIDTNAAYPDGYIPKDCVDPDTQAVKWTGYYRIGT